MKDTNILEMSHIEFNEWLMDLAKVPGVSDEEYLIFTLSEALRATTTRERASLLIDVANQSIAMADVALGAYRSRVKCRVVTKH